MDNRKVSPGGGPTRNTTLPTDAAGRKQFPIATGFLDYFPDAIAAIAALSKKGSDQHNPGKPMFWDRSKSTDEDDTAMRHFLQRGTLDNDGVRHTVKACWRMLAFLQKELETAQLADSLLTAPGAFMAVDDRCEATKLKCQARTPKWAENACGGEYRANLNSIGLCDYHRARWEESL